MERHDIVCVTCGKLICTEQKDNSGNIKCVAGGYNNGQYDSKEDAYYCNECLKQCR